MTAEQRYDYYYEALAEEESGSENKTLETESETKDKEAEREHEIRYRRTEVKSGAIMRIVVVSVLAAALLGSVIYSLDHRNRMYNKVSAMNRKLSQTEAEHVRLQSELDSKMSAKNVEEYAEKELGMQKIDNSQIKYIKIQTDDVVNIPEQDETLMTKIEGFFDGIVEYFRG
ncbi:MAG TPA: cell division protein FtsL [Ruminococcus sp.]|nr:cell division protein FtsL [Ruminococcus sp.]